MRADARRSRQAILAAAGELFAGQGSEAQMPEIATRAGVGMGTMYRHFATKQALLMAIIGQRFGAMAEMAREAEQIEDPAASFDALVVGYLEAAELDAAFRYALLGPEKTAWAEIAEQKNEFASVVDLILRRAVAAGYLRKDLTFTDFVLITRGVMANMNPEDGDWRRLLALLFESIHANRDPAERP